LANDNPASLRLGLISDIHGDIAHLHTALDLLEQQRVDQVLCTGDLTHGEPHENEVIETLRARRIACTMGNHDAETAQKPPAQQQVTPENRAFLESLPMTYSLEVAGKRVLMTHATPANHSIHVFSYSHVSLLRGLIAAADGANAIIIGHTHEPMRILIDGTWIFNPGSVYQNRFVEGQSCAILSLPDFEFTVYDLATGSPTIIPLRT
jgi:putative phosphoesterase